MFTAYFPNRARDFWPAWRLDFSQLSSQPGKRCCIYEMLFATIHGEKNIIWNKCRFLKMKDSLTVNFRPVWSIKPCSWWGWSWLTQTHQSHQWTIFTNIFRTIFKLFASCLLFTYVLLQHAFTVESLKSMLSHILYRCKTYNRDKVVWKNAKAICVFFTEAMQSKLNFWSCMKNAISLNFVTRHWVLHGFVGCISYFTLFNTM